MNEIPSIGPGGLTPTDSQYRHQRVSEGSDASRAGIPLRRMPDSLDLSPTAKRLILLDRVKNDPPVREELIDRVKQEIAQDRYDSRDKIDRVIEELWADFFADSGELDTQG